MDSALVGSVALSSRLSCRLFSGDELDLLRGGLLIPLVKALKRELREAEAADSFEFPLVRRSTLPSRVDREEIPLEVAVDWLA